MKRYCGEDTERVVSWENSTMPEFFILYFPFVGISVFFPFFLLIRGRKIYGNNKKTSSSYWWDCHKKYTIILFFIAKLHLTFQLVSKEREQPINGSLFGPKQEEDVRASFFVKKSTRNS